MAGRHIDGVGTLFYAEDRGASKTAEDVGKAIKGATREAVSAGRAGSAGINRMGSAISALNHLQISRVRDALNDLNSSAASGLNVSSTSLESWGAQFGQTYRAATAGLGGFRGAVDAVRGQISGVSYELQIGAEDLLGAVTVMARNGHTLDEYGLSMRGLGGLIQAGIISGEQLGGVLTNLSQSYRLGAAGAGSLVDRMVALGTQFGVGADALRAFPNAMTALDEVTSQFPMMQDNIEGTTEAIFRLAMAASTQGGSFESHMESALGVFRHLGEVRTQMTDLFTGISSEFPQLVERIGLSTQDIGGSFDAVMQDPMRFAASMAQAYNGMDSGSRTAALLRTALQNMGPGFEFLIQGGEASAEALRRASGAITDAANATEHLGRAAGGSTRTFAESMDLLTERFQTQLGAMVHSMPGYQNFERRVLVRQRDAYQALEVRIERFVGGSGILARLGRAALATRRGGLGGLTLAIQTELGGAFPTLNHHLEATIPLLSDLGSGALEAATDAAPLLIAVNQLGIRVPHLGSVFGLLLNPITLLIAGIVYLAVRGDRASGDLDKLVDRIGSISQLATDFSGRMLTAVHAINWETIGRDLVGGLLSAFGAISSDSIDSKKFFANVFNAVEEIVVGLTHGMWGRLVEYIMQPDDLEGKVTNAGRATGVAIGGALAVALASPFRGAFLRGTVGLVGRIGLRAIPGIGVILGMILDLPQIIHSFRVDGISAGILEIIRSAFNGVLLGIPAIIQHFTGFDIIGMLLNTLGIGRFLEATAAGDWPRAISEFVFGMFNTALFGIPGLVRTIVENWTGDDIFGGFINLMSFNIQAIGDVFSTVFEFVNSNVVPILQRLGAAAMDVFGVIGGVVSDVWTGTILPILSGLWDGLSGFFTRAWDLATEVFGALSDTFTDTFGTLSGGSAYFQDLADTISWLWNNILLPIFRAFGTVYSWIVNHVLAPVIQAFRAIGAIVGWLWDRVLHPIASLIIWSFTTGFRDIFTIATTVFRGIAAVVGWWWRNIMKPVLDALWATWNWLWPRISNFATSTYAAIGDEFDRMWNYLEPAINWISETWGRVMGRISDVATRVWNAISGFVTDKFDMIVAGILYLQQSWSSAMNVMKTGIRLIGAILGFYMIGPLMEAKRGILNMIEAIFSGMELIFRYLHQATQETMMANALVVVRRQLEGVSDEELANGGRARRLELDRAREAVNVALEENQAAFNQAVHQVSFARRSGRGGVPGVVPPVPEPNAPVASHRATRSGGVVTSRGAHPVADSRPSGVPGGVSPVPEPNAPVANHRAIRPGRVVISRGAHPVADSRPSGGPGAGRSPAGRENVAEQARQARQAQAREIAREVRISSFGSEAEVTLRRVFSHVIVSFGSPERSRAE